MSDAFFHKVFGDSEPTNVGSGWITGVLGVFFGLLGMGGALCLHFPALLTLPDARAHYPMTIIRLLIQGMIAAAFVCAAISAVLRQRKVLALTGGLLAAIAALLDECNFAGMPTIVVEQEAGNRRARHGNSLECWRKQSSLVVKYR